MVWDFGTYKPLEGKHLFVLLDTGDLVVGPPRGILQVMDNAAIRIQAQHETVKACSPAAEALGLERLFYIMLFFRSFLTQDCLCWKCYGNDKSDSAGYSHYPA